MSFTTPSALTKVDEHAISSPIPCSSMMLSVTSAASGVKGVAADNFLCRTHCPREDLLEDLDMCRRSAASKRASERLVLGDLSSDSVANSGLADRLPAAVRRGFVTGVPSADPAAVKEADEISGFLGTLAGRLVFSGVTSLRSLFLGVSRKLSCSNIAGPASACTAARARAVMRTFDAACSTCRRRSLWHRVAAGVALIAALMDEPKRSVDVVSVS
mmetsp:Transcript_72934/g.173734  ORF Transcript_72934/g.173734 Transcript_72934/m.173734 type:complete len:216 (-) Transcript_72934:982-1629(-)